MLKRFTQFIEQHSLCSRESSILLAVSGGIDSMVMTDLFRSAGYRIKVAHVNFQLRGAESDLDRDFVADFCSKNGIEFHATKVDTNNYAIEHKLSVQMAARELRYEWFDKLLKDNEGDVIATAHHLNDSIETLLLNLIKGSSNEGLRGIPIKSSRVIRPLMFATRIELESYAAEHSIIWREDESNQSIDYQRNEIRHNLIPAIRSINPGFEQSFQRMMLRATGEEQVMQHALNQWRDEFIQSGPDQFRIDKKGVALFSRPEALLLRILAPYGFNLSQCIDLAGQLNGQPGKVFYSATHQLVIDRAFLVVSMQSTALAPVNISSGERRSALGHFELAIDEHSVVSPDRNPMVSYLDKEKVSFPLQWRTWEEGDYFFPLGMKGRKKVSDFLIDLKLSLTDKQSVTVIESPQGIVCLPGFRIDDRFKVTEQTRSTLVLTLQRQTKKMPPVTEAF